MSTHNIYFCGEIWKISLNYHKIPTLSVLLLMKAQAVKFTKHFQIIVGLVIDLTRTAAILQHLNVA